MIEPPSPSIWSSEVNKDRTGREDLPRHDRPGWTLTERTIDEDCGCPEEFWDTPYGFLHMHLSDDGRSNACLDSGDEGERELSDVLGSVDEARVAITRWVETGHVG